MDRFEAEQMRMMMQRGVYELQGIRTLLSEHADRNAHMMRWLTMHHPEALQDYYRSTSVAEQFKR